MSLNERLEMIEKAISVFGEIFACGKCKELHECFQELRFENMPPKIIFWFNDSNNSTHVIMKLL